MEAPTDDQIRAVYAAFSERREADTELFHPDVEWHNDPEWPGAGVHRGIEAVQRDLQAFTNRARARAAAGLP